MLDSSEIYFHVLEISKNSFNLNVLELRISLECVRLFATVIKNFVPEFPRYSSQIDQ